VWIPNQKQKTYPSQPTYASNELQKSKTKQNKGGFKKIRKNNNKKQTNKQTHTIDIISLVRWLGSRRHPQKTGRQILSNHKNSNSRIHHQHTNTLLQKNIHVSKVHCGSAVRFSQALPGLFVIAHYLCVLLCFINLILGNCYGPGVSSCQQTSDNNLGWPDPHPSP